MSCDGPLWVCRRCDYAAPEVPLYHVCPDGRRAEDSEPLEEKLRAPRWAAAREPRGNHES